MATVGVKGFNAAAQVITNTRFMHHTIRHAFHRLDMTQRVQFRIAWHGSRISLSTVFSSKTETIKISTPVFTE